MVEQVWVIDAVALVLFIIQCILPVLAGLLLASAADDLFVDIVYVVRRVWRAFSVYRHHPRMTAATLTTAPLKNIAVMIPAWAEADVIGAMLRTTTTLWPDRAVHFFVGLYPNDPATAAAVAGQTVRDPRVHAITGMQAGPTTKADCLNTIWTGIQALEVQQGLTFDAFVLHDCEDLVSAREIHVISHLIGRIDMLQFPVRPLVVPGSLWVSGHYLDEFAESHGKDLAVREWLGAALPSAGVGCAFSRAALAHAARQRGGLPFETRSLTEDYELAVRLGQAGFAQAFITLPAAPAHAAIATCEYFPSDFAAAVRQKARWLVGISLQGWDQLRWHGSLADRYMFVRDRKALATAFLNALAMGIAAILLAVSVWQHLDAHAPQFAPLVAPGSALAAVLWLNGYFCLHRLAVRAAFVWRAQGAGQALLCVPRTAVACAINFAAAVRAIRLYALARLGNGSVPWDKTAHRFPGVMLAE